MLLQGIRRPTRPWPRVTQTATQYPRKGVILIYAVQSTTIHTATRSALRFSGARLSTSGSRRGPRSIYSLSVSLRSVSAACELRGAASRASRTRPQPHHTAPATASHRTSCPRLDPLDTHQTPHDTLTLLSNTRAGGATHRRPTSTPTLCATWHARHATLLPHVTAISQQSPRSTRLGAVPRGATSTPPRSLTAAWPLCLAPHCSSSLCSRATSLGMNWRMGPTCEGK